MMNYLQAAFLGIIEGLTEFLPISSTFHLIVSSKILGLPSTDFQKLFEVVIQSGAIFALIFLYAKTLLSNPKLLKNVIYAFIPTAIVGFTLHKIIKTVFFDSSWLMISVFILVGIIFLLLEKYLSQHKIVLNKTCEDITLMQAMIIGLAQATSVVPGVSRSGSIIVAMMSLGYKREEAAKFTFLLSLPTIFAATGLDLLQSRALLLSQAGGWSLLAIGTIFSLIFGYLVVKWFIAYLSKHTLVIFGWYRLAVAALLLVFKVLP